MESGQIRKLEMIERVSVTSSTLEVQFYERVIEACRIEILDIFHPHRFDVLERVSLESSFDASARHTILRSTSNFGVVNEISDSKRGGCGFESTFDLLELILILEVDVDFNKVWARCEYSDIPRECFCVSSNLVRERGRRRRKAAEFEETSTKAFERDDELTENTKAESVGE